MTGKAEVKEDTVTSIEMEFSATSATLVNQEYRDTEHENLSFLHPEGCFNFAR